MLGRYYLITAFFSCFSFFFWLFAGRDLARVLLRVIIVTGFILFECDGIIRTQRM